MSGEELDLRSAGLGAEGRGHVEGEGNESQRENCGDGLGDAVDGLEGDGLGALTQQLEEQFMQSQRRTGSSRGDATSERPIAGESRGKTALASVTHDDPQNPPDLDVEGHAEGTRRQRTAENSKEGLVGGAGSANGGGRAHLQDNSFTGQTSLEQAVEIKEAELERDGKSQNVPMSREDHDGREGLATQEQAASKVHPSGPAQGFALSLPLKNLQAVAAKAHQGRQKLKEGGPHDAMDYQELETDKLPERQARTFDIQEQAATGRRDANKQRAGSNTMLGDSVSTNNSPYYIQALENGPVLHGAPARVAAMRTRLGSMGASTAAGSINTKGEGQRSGGPRTVLAGPRPPSLEAQVGVQSRNLQGSSGVAAKAPRTANNYGERARPRKLSNDLWNKVQLRRAQAKATAGSCRVKSLNLETRGLLALNKKEQHRYDTIARTRQQVENTSKPMFWNAQVQGNVHQYENLLGARGAGLRQRGAQHRAGAAGEAKIGENTPTLNKTQTVSSASHTFGNANSGAIGALEKDTNNKALRPAFGQTPAAQGKSQAQATKGLEQTAKQSSLHDSTENESPGPAVREPRSCPGGPEEDMRNSQLAKGLKLKDQLRDVHGTRQLTASTGRPRPQDVARPVLAQEKPAFVGVHERLSQNKGRCALNCRFLQEERVPLAAASAELSFKARGSVKPHKSRNAEMASQQPENRYSRAPGGGRLYHAHNTFSRTYLRDYLETSGPSERDQELLDWATLEAVDDTSRQDVAFHDVLQRRPRLEQRGRATTQGSTGRPSVFQGQQQRVDDRHSRAKRPFESPDGHDDSFMASRSAEKWRDVIHQCTQAADQAAHRQVLTRDQARDVSILKESYHRIYPLNLNKQMGGQATLFRPMAAAREPMRKFLQNRHANAHLEPSVATQATGQSRLSQGQAEQQAASSAFNARVGQAQASEEIDQEEDGAMAQSLGAHAGQIAADYAEKRKQLRTVDALVQRPVYNFKQMSNEPGGVLQDGGGLQRTSLVGQLAGPEARQMQFAAAGHCANKPKTRQEGSRPRHRKYGSLDSNAHAMEQWLSTNLPSSQTGQAQEGRTISIEKVNNAVSQLSTLTSAVDTASKSGQATSTHHRAKSQILQNQIYNKTMISNLNNITSHFLKEQIVEEIILNEYGDFLEEQPYAAQDEAKDFVLQPKVYDKVVESQLPMGGKWFPEQSDAIKVGKRGAIKDITTHYKSTDPRTMIREQMALNSKRQEFQQFKAQLQARQAAVGGASPVLAADRTRQEVLRQLWTLAPGPSTASQAGRSAFGLPLAAYSGNSAAVRPDYSSIQPPFASHTVTQPPDVVDTQTRCEYEKQPGEDKREYQLVHQRVSERAKVKLYVRADLKKVQDHKQKYHRHIQRQIHDKAYQKKIKLEDFVQPESVDFGITTTLLENEHIIPNQDLHLDFYPQRRPQDKHRHAQQERAGQAQAKDVDSMLSVRADGARKAGRPVAQHIEEIMDSYRAEQRRQGEMKMVPGQEGKRKAASPRTTIKQNTQTAKGDPSKPAQSPASKASQIEPDAATAADLGDGTGKYTPRLQSLLESLVVLSHQQAKTTTEKRAKEKQDEEDFNNLFYYQQYLAKNELGRDIFRTQQKEFNELLEKFQHQDDWFRDVLNVRKHKLLDPEKDLDGDGVPDDEQEVLQIRGGVAGQLLNGVFYTREQLEAKIEQRRQAYFDLFELAQSINKGLKGDLTQHGTREKLAKLKSIDDLEKMMSVKELLALIKPVPQRQPFE